MKLTHFAALTFDCYGTLIDWETGIYNALRPMIDHANLGLSRDELLASFAAHEAALEAENPLARYSSLLEEIHRRLTLDWDVKATDADHLAFAASLQSWPAFSDAASSLAYLRQHFKLFILSNVDRSGFESSRRQLGITFDAIYTAEDIGSYKPSIRNFEYMLNAIETLHIPKRQVLHTAQSLFHDHAPANAVGLASAWIDRRHDKIGYGATPQPERLPTYDFRFASLKEMVEHHQRELSKPHTESP